MSSIFVILSLDLVLIHGPLTRYGKLRVTHAPGMPETFSPPWLQRKPQVSDLCMHHSTCVTHVCLARAMMHVGIANPWWRGKCSRHSWHLHNPQFHVFGKRPMLIHISKFYPFEFIPMWYDLCWLQVMLFSYCIVYPMSVNYLSSDITCCPRPGSTLVAAMFAWQYQDMASTGVELLTHWGQMTHICIIELTIIGSTNHHYTPRTTKLLGGYTGFTPSVRPSVRPSVCPSVCPSVRPSRMPCPLCIIYSYGWILFMLGTNDHYHERVCRAPWPLTLTYIFKVIGPWLRKSCPLCSVYSSGWILSIFGTNDHYH